MNFTNEDESFLKDLVKGSRQRVHQIKWADRDGTPRLTVLNAADNVRVCELARRMKLSPAEVMRQASFIPVAKPAAAPVSAAPVQPLES